MLIYAKFKFYKICGGIFFNAHIFCRLFCWLLRNLFDKFADQNGSLFESDYIIDIDYGQSN